MSTKRRTLGVYSQPRPLGPDGEKLCFNCRKPLPKGRPFNCSPKCSEEWRGKTSPAWMRHLLFKRDKGVCVTCGADTEALKREYKALPKHDSYNEWSSYQSPEREAFLKKHGIPWGRVVSDWWDADHITPVVEGGGECGLDNLRTLCLPCHRVATKELHARMKARREDGQKARMLVLSEKRLDALTGDEVRELKELRLKYRSGSQALNDSFNFSLFEIPQRAETSVQRETEKTS